MEARICQSCGRRWHSSAFEEYSKCQACGGMLKINENTQKLKIHELYPYGQNPRGECPKCGRIFWGWALVRMPGEEICVCGEELNISVNEASLDPSLIA